MSEYDVPLVWELVDGSLEISDSPLIRTVKQPCCAEAMETHEKLTGGNAMNESKKKSNYYEVTNISLCYNCKHSERGASQLMLTCTSSEAWLSPMAVEPTGHCRYWERREKPSPYGDGNTDGVDETRKDNSTV